MMYVCMIFMMCDMNYDVEIEFIKSSHAGHSHMTLRRDESSRLDFSIKRQTLSLQHVAHFQSACVFSREL